MGKKEKKSLLMPKANRSNSKTNKLKQLNYAKLFDNVQRDMFKKLPETRAVLATGEKANIGKMGLVMKLNDERGDNKHKRYLELQKKKDPTFEMPKPIEIIPPEEKKKVSTPFMREYQWDFIIPLVEAYGTNYKAMARDTKRNFLFKTEAALRKMCLAYHEVKAYGESKVDEYMKADSAGYEAYMSKRPQKIEGTVLGAPPKQEEVDAKTDNKRKREDGASKTDKKTKTDVTKSDTKDDTTTPKTDETNPNTTTDTTTPTTKTTKTKPATKTDKTKPNTKNDVTKPDTTETTTTTTKPAAKTKQPAKNDVTKPTDSAAKTDAAKPAQNGKPAPAKNGKPEPAKNGKPEPAKTGKPAPAKAKPGKKPSLDDSDSDVEGLEGMEFDFDENDLSSDDE